MIHDPWIQSPVIDKVKHFTPSNLWDTSARKMFQELIYHVFLPSGLVSPKLLSLIVLSIISLIYILKWEHKKSKDSYKLRTINDLPQVRNLGFWVPPLVEGLATSYFGIKGGVKSWNDWWLSLNKPPIFTIISPTFRGTKLVVVNSPDLIRKILGSSNHNMLQKPSFFYNLLVTELIKDGIAAAKVSIWEPHRKILNQFFAYRNLPQLFKVIKKYSKEIVSSLEREIVSGDKLCALIDENLLKIILDIAMGPGTVEKYGVQQFSNYFHKIKSLAAYRMTHPECKLDFLWSFHPKKKENDECVEYIQRYVSKGISWAKENMKENGELSSSAVEHMLRHKMDENQIQVEVTTLLVAGDETTSTATHLLLQHLAENPEIQEKCFNEIQSLYDSKANDVLTMDDLSSLKYLEYCILESLRMAPPIPGFSREMGELIELDGTKIEKGTVTVIIPWLLHRNSEIYPEPEKFDPDRFIPEKVKQRHHYAYLPFSMGPRNCIGWKMAMMSIKTVVALLLKNYKIKTKDRFADIKLLFEVTLVPERKFDIFVAKR